MEENTEVSVHSEESEFQIEDNCYLVMDQYKFDSDHVWQSRPVKYAPVGGAVYIGATRSEANVDHLIAYRFDSSDVDISSGNLLRPNCELEVFDQLVGYYDGKPDEDLLEYEDAWLNSVVKRMREQDPTVLECFDDTLLLGLPLRGIPKFEVHRHRTFCVFSDDNGIIDVNAVLSLGHLEPHILAGLDNWSQIAIRYVNIKVGSPYHYTQPMSWYTLQWDSFFPGKDGSAEPTVYTGLGQRDRYVYDCDGMFVGNRYSDYWNPGKSHRGWLEALKLGRVVIKGKTREKACCVLCIALEVEYSLAHPRVFTFPLPVPK